MKQEIEALLEHALMKNKATNFDNVAAKNYWRGKIAALTQVLYLLEKDKQQNDNSSDY